MRTSSPRLRQPRLRRSRAPRRRRAPPARGRPGSTSPPPAPLRRRVDRPLDALGVARAPAGQHSQRLGELAARVGDLVGEPRRAAPSRAPRITRPRSASLRSRPERTFEAMPPTSSWRSPKRSGPASSASTTSIDHRSPSPRGLPRDLGCSPRPSLAGASGALPCFFRAEAPDHHTFMLACLPRVSSNLQVTMEVEMAAVLEEIGKSSEDGVGDVRRCGRRRRPRLARRYRGS